MKWMFKEDYSLKHRCVESAKIRAKYPYRIPVIEEKVSGTQIVAIAKRRFLVPSDITWLSSCRSSGKESGFLLRRNKTVPQSSLTLGQLYQRKKDEDGFFYVACNGENTFGF